MKGIKECIGVQDKKRIRIKMQEVNFKGDAGHIEMEIHDSNSVTLGLYSMTNMIEIGNIEMEAVRRLKDFLNYAVKD